MKKIIIIFFVFLLYSCSGSGAKELYETARFEELQNNGRNAKALYEEILKDYPESDYVDKAKERIKALEK